MKAVRKNNRKIRSRVAFTLVEIMVAIMLTTVVLTAIYMIWFRIQQGIARSNTRQTLQNELRKAANYMQNDFKSIKFEKDNFKLSEAGSGNFSMSFEKFKETEDGKLAQDSIEKVGYELKGNLLTRKGDKANNILSVHCDAVSIARAVDEASTGLESADKDFKAGREAKLDITIAGKMIVPGSGEEMYHVEKTSVVMRNEYYKNTNKTYVSVFDLIKKQSSEVIQEGSSQEFEVGAVLDEEYLKTLDDDILSGMETTQKDMLKNAEDSLKSLNDAIKDTETGESGWSKFWNKLAFWDTTDGEKFREMRTELVKAKTVDEVNNVKDKLQEFVKDREEQFLGKSIDGWYRMSEKDKDIYKKAYEMKLQDRTIEGGRQKALEKAETEEEKKELEENKTPLMIETLKGQNTGSVTIEDKNNQKQVLSSSQNTAENEAIIKAYDKINLDWMGEFGNEPNEVGAYNAAKSLLTQADSKIDIINMKTNCETNIEKIKTAMANN